MSSSDQVRTLRRVPLLCRVPIAKGGMQTVTPRLTNLPFKIAGHHHLAQQVRTQFRQVRTQVAYLEDFAHFLTGEGGTYCPATAELRLE
jgi:hypothetical protein